MWCLSESKRKPEASLRVDGGWFMVCSLMMVCLCVCLRVCVSVCLCVLLSFVFLHVSFWIVRVPHSDHSKDHPKNQFLMKAGGLGMWGRRCIRAYKSGISSNSCSVDASLSSKHAKITRTILAIIKTKHVHTTPLVTSKGSGAAW